MINEKVEDKITVVVFQTNLLEVVFSRVEIVKISEKVVLLVIIIVIFDLELIIVRYGTIITKDY